MTFYIVISGIFLIISGGIYIINQKDKYLAPYFSFLFLLFFIVISGLRFNTGYDWLIYERYFYSISGFSLTDYQNTYIVMEPLYYLLCVVSKFLFNDFQFLLFIVSFFNGIVLFKFSRFLKVPFYFLFSFYFCWLYLTVQMGVIRQSLCISFVLLSFISFSNHSKWKSGLLFILSLGFHLSAFLYIFLFFRRLNRYIVKYSLPIIVLSILFYFSNIGGAQTLIYFLSKINLPMISEKAALYITFGFSERTFGNSLYLFFNIILYFFLFTKNKKNKKNHLVNAMLASQVILIVLQSAFFDLPILWNRMQYLTVIFQIAMFYSILYNSVNQYNSFLFFLGGALLSVASLTHQLNNHMMMPYKPYYSLIDYWLSNDEGNGLERTIEYYDLFNSNLNE